MTVIYNALGQVCIVQPFELNDMIVSEGTLRNEDLFNAYCTEIDRLDLGYRLTGDLNEFVNKASCSEIDWDTETATEGVIGLQDFLNDQAPEGWLLKASEGDGALFLWQPQTLTARLKGLGHVWSEDSIEGQVIDHFDDEPDFKCYSDWVNQAEPMCSDLIKRFDWNEDEVENKVDNYVSEVGYNSWTELMNDVPCEIDSIKMEMVNIAYTAAMGEIESTLEMS